RSEESRRSVCSDARLRARRRVPRRRFRSQTLRHALPRGERVSTGPSLSRRTLCAYRRFLPRRALSLAGGLLELSVRDVSGYESQLLHANLLAELRLRERIRLLGRVRRTRVRSLWVATWKALP